MHHFNYFSVHDLLALNTFTVLSPLSISKMFSSPQTETLLIIKQKLYIPCPPPRSLATSNLFPMSMNFPIIHNSCKWNHTIFVLLCLAYFTQHNVFKAHLHCSVYRNMLITSYIKTSLLMAPQGPPSLCFYLFYHILFFFSICFQSLLFRKQIFSPYMEGPSHP